jgi:protein SCO1/2
MGLLGVLASAVLVFGQVARNGGPQTPPLPELGEVPTFRFTNQDGKALGSAELSGTPYIVDFIFTRCESICPRLTERMAGLHQRLAPLGNRVRFVSITVDPDNDTPERLKAYASAHHAAMAGWDFLTGDGHAVEDAVVHGFHMTLAQPVGDERGQVLHGSQLILVDGRGQLRGYYEAGDDAALESLVTAAKKLAASPLARR